jgi:dTDP-4-dehydrorhamnose reductase
MRVLITGAKGMLGRDLVEIMSGHFEVSGIDIDDADITRFEEIEGVVREKNPEFIIHCAGYTDVDGCESEKDLSYKVNAIGTRNVTRCAADLDIPILYISTDFVFNGKKDSPYREYDMPEPISEYGYTKLTGEYFVQNLHNKFFIVRTAWLFGLHGKNFVKTILNIARNERDLRVVFDQTGSPTYTWDLSRKIVELIDSGAGYGIYHITNSGVCSWCDFARKILDIAGCTDVILQPISTEETGRAARRPSNSALENRALRLEGLKPMRSWEEALADYLANSEIMESMEQK